MTRDNRPMELTESQVKDLEDALTQMEELDAADLPEPAAKLAATLSAILDELEPS